MNSWLNDNGIKIYSTHRTSVAEKFSRILKTKICKHMTGISKKVYITKLDKLVKKCNNTYYETIKTKLVDVQQDISKYNKDIF